MCQCRHTLSIEIFVLRGVSGVKINCNSKRYIYALHYKCKHSMVVEKAKAAPLKNIAFVLYLTPLPSVYVFSTGDRHKVTLSHVEFS